MKLNTARIWLGGIAGGVVWTLWGMLIGLKMNPLYMAAQERGLFLKEPRNSAFVVEWIAIVFVMSILLAYLYAWSRATAGSGPRTAIKIGMIVGFCAGVPSNLAQATWSPIPTMLPLGWMLDMWGGAILATLAAAWLYKDKA